MTNLEKVQAAIDYIEDHLNEKLDLETIAEAIHYSKYHLHRVFSKTVGLTIHEYRKRRQLTEAAKLLVFSEQPILEIAVLAGYESQQAFTAAFTAMYKLPPKEYRENEEFYPLQLKFQFEGSYSMLKNTEKTQWTVTHAIEEDIPCWMDLVRLAIDGFPHLHEEDYIEELEKRMARDEALILKDGETAVGIMLFACDTGSIDFMAVHPLYRSRGIPRAFLDRVMGAFMKGKEISITTYREGDKADTGHRRAIMDLGFAEAELLVEFGYPTQRFVLTQEVLDEA